MNISTEEFMDLQGGMSAKDVRIAQLEGEVERLKEERDMWQARALETDGTMKESVSFHNRFIVISRQKLRSVLEKIHDVKLLGFLELMMQKCLRDNATAEECQAIAEVVPLPQPPCLSLTAEGDINVEGNWSDIHDNEKVHF